jgi:hypothetical protein
MRIAVLAAAMAGPLLWEGPGLAQDVAGPECGSFTLERMLGILEFVDVGAEGKSPGDQRVLTNTLTDQDGKKVGSLHIVATLLAAPGPEGEDLLLANAVAEFPNGTISVISSCQLMPPRRALVRISPTLAR